MYTRNKKDAFKSDIELALANYAESVFDSCAASAIMRHAKNGRLEGRNRFVNAVLDEYSQKMNPIERNAYLILRFARKSLLSYKPEI